MAVSQKNILSARDFDRKYFEYIFSSARKMEIINQERRSIDLLRGKILTSVFSEPSMRTKLSFEAAMIRLGGQIVGSASTDGARANSSLQESLQDTARIIGGYADVAVIRHTAPHALAIYAQRSGIPIINAGSGQGAGSEHPTQALLDLYTIDKELGRVDGIRLLVIGSLQKRAARSLLLGLRSFEGVELYLLCPNEYWLSPSDEREIRSGVTSLIRIEDIREIVHKVDVIYHSGQAADTQPQLPERYFLTAESLRSAKSNAIVLHPLPRPGSISIDVDDTSHARYFEGAKNGTAIRMALLASIFDYSLQGTC